ERLLLCAPCGRAVPATRQQSDFPGPADRTAAEGVGCSLPAARGAPGLQTLASPAPGQASERARELCVGVPPGESPVGGDPGRAPGALLYARGAADLEGAPRDRAGGGDGQAMKAGHRRGARLAALALALAAGLAGPAPARGVEIGPEED